jgi:competence protein ComEC
MVWHYHLVTPISLLANLVVVPIAFFVLANGLISMVAAPVSIWLSVVFNNTNWFLTKIILGAVHWFAQIPGGHFYVEYPHWPDGTRIEINALDLKSGAAVHIRTKESDWLCDAGSLHDYDRVVRQYLRCRGVNRLAGLILTHGDASHIGGGSGALFDFHPGQLIDPATPDRSPIHRRLIAEIARTAGPHRPSAAGDEFDLASDVKARILFPPHGFEAVKADDQALVVQLAVSGKSRVLIMSDSGVATEEFLLRNYPDLRCDIVVKGQHYSGISGSEAFLDSVRPGAIVATSSDFPENERIKNEWVERVEARGIKLFRQDETGAVRIKIFRAGWEATTYVTSETFRSTSR